MAKKYYNGEITLNTDWGGDESTGNLPVVGSRVQEAIKKGINSKAGFVGRVEKVGQGFYVLSRDEATFNEYLKTISDENPFGDLTMDGIIGRFDAPFNYKMNITLINPENGYKSTLLGSTGNVIKFRAETLDNNNTPQGESVTVTYKIKTEGGVENTFTAIYDGNIASQGIEYNLDGKLGSGVNTVTITVVGMNTGISAMRRITYRLVDMYFKDKFDMTKRYQFTPEGTMAMTVGYDLKGVGETKLLWYFDGNHYTTDKLANLNPNLSNNSRSFYFTEHANSWLTPGIHNIQMCMACKDTDSGEEFYTPIYYREFIVEKTPTVLNTPYIVTKLSFDYSKGFLANGDKPTIYDAKQFENVEIEYAAYYNGKSTCKVSSFIKYNGDDLIEYTTEDLPLVEEDFSNERKQSFSLTEEGAAEIILRSFYDNDSYFETVISLTINASDMDIKKVEDNIVLYLNAFGRSNNASGKDVWEYKYKDEYQIEHIIETEFSKNEYSLISTLDINGNVIAPEDANENNTRIVSELPLTEDENFKYIQYNNEYYIWNREFDWSDTSGWSDNKLKLANGNAITINYKPFSEANLALMKAQGATFEFEFETTNVYNDNAVICRICGNDNFAPGIVITASGAELVISRKIVTGENDTNAGYTQKVSTKYKSEESNRISFVITPDSDEDGYRNRILSIYVNGELCGAYAYAHGTNFYNDSKITFRGSEDACVNISTIEIISRALNSNEILNNYIYYRNDGYDKTNAYKRNDIMLESNDETFDSDKLKSQLPVMMIYQINPEQSLDDIHQEKKNKKLTRFFDVVYIDIQNPSKNFLVKNAYITPQGTSSMNYPVKNLRLYTGKKDKSGEYYSRLFVGSNIFKDGSPNNLSWDNINLDTEVKKKRQYAFKEGAIPVNCWCLKADFAESSSSHNTGTSRYWNQVLKNAGFTTKAQAKAKKYEEDYPYDIRTAIDGFPIVVFYQQLDGSAPRFEGKYNFNNDKSTESVFGFTGGIEIEDQEVKYFYIGKERPIVHSETNDEGVEEWACSIESGAYTENPTTDSPLYASKKLQDGSEEWYMLRGKELLDNPKMECWELLNSVNDIALFKTMKGFGVGDDDEKIGIVKDNGDFDGAFESRYPDCGDYYHYNSLKRFGEWLVSCRYLTIDNETGESVPFTLSSMPTENYHKNNENKLSICSLTKQTGEFKFNFPGKNFYSEIDYNLISSAIKNEGYQQISVSNEIIGTIDALEVDSIPETKIEGYEYIKHEELYYTWMPSNVLVTDTLPNVQEISYDYVLVGETYYVWANTYKFEDYHETQWVDDNPFNRALKFAVEKFDYIEMDKMAAYYIYLMRFGGVDQTVKNSMLTTEGPASDDPNSKLPSLWYFINYDNDTILGVKNDGRLVFDPYITRQTKDGTGYVYAGRESTLWNNLEFDTQFMDKVTEVDNKLTSGGANPLYSLSYSNALREYDTNQSDKWCERIYNKDAERKYIDTYVKGWVQKNDAEHTETHVYEDYLYDVQGSRSAHRKWWLGRRFNVFDSRFCNTNFRNQLIKFRSTNLPAGSSFTIKSGEPIFYAWGHDNAVTEMTQSAIQPGDEYTFTTSSAFNIGSYLELMGAANISSLNLRECVGALTEIDITGCYSSSVGTKLKELLIGDNNNPNLINISNTNLKFSGLDKASKLEVIDVTNIQNADKLDGLNTLLNIRKVYAKGTSIANFTFADGALIETLELPESTETLSLTRSSSIDYNSISFDGDNFGKLNNLTIDNCSKLMNNPDFVLQWIGSKTDAQKANLNLNLQGINWTFDINNYGNLFLLEKVGTAGMAQRNIRGTIEITSRLDISDIVRLKSIFGNECFKEGSKVYIKAPTGLYVNIPSKIWEGESNIKCEITTVGTTLSGELRVSASVKEMIDGEEVTKIINSTNGIVTMDESNLDKDYVLINFAESNNVYTYLILTVNYYDGINPEMMEVASSIVNKRIYPTEITVTSIKNSYNNKEKNKLNLLYTPEIINDVQLEGRGKFNIKWEMAEGSNNYENSLVLYDADKETSYIQAPNGFDGTVIVKATATRIYDNIELCSNTKEIEFTNPDTIITRYSNEPIYNVLVNAGIIKEDETGFGKLTKTEAASLTMKDLLNEKGESIFANNTEITSFIEFQYFSGTYMGQMPTEGVDAVTTPVGMFKGCTKLKEIAFSNNFKYANKDMFMGCTSLEYIYGPYIKDDEFGNPIYSNLALVEIHDNFAKNCTNLISCLLSPTAKYIGKEAFSGCKKLQSFQLPTGVDVEMSYEDTNTPFIGCENIMFMGAEYGGISEAKYRVKDGACYQINDDNTVTLIHMGKDTLMSSIPTDKTVFAAAYSMEYRTEPDIIVPENVTFNGERIFYGSIGNSITLTKSLSLKCNELFYNTKYNGNYYFAPNETYIPAGCFFQVSDMAEFVIPEGITNISKRAFYGCTKLNDITLPSTIKEIDTNVFWLCKLKNITCKSPLPPVIKSDILWGQILEKFKVYPEYYDTYKSNILNILSPFVTPIKLYGEGYVRIIKDGQYLFSDENNIVTVGNIQVSQESEFMKYITNGENSDINVYLNNEIIGEIKGKYTTLYIGDNSSLFTGDGLNFRYGVYNEEILKELTDNNWIYDARFEGVRNDSYIDANKECEINLNLPSYANKDMKVSYGMYSEVDANSCYGYIKNSNNEIILKNTTNGYNISNIVKTTDGNISAGYIYNNTKTGINAFILHEVGDSIYSDPELPLMTTFFNGNNINVKNITINLDATVEIPDNVYVTLSDDKGRVYRKYWEGQTLLFTIPNDSIFNVTASNFITENGKEYFIEKNENIVTDIINLTYTCKSGIVLTDNILSVYTEDTDWYINLERFNGPWSNINHNIDNVNTVEILSSDANGLENTKIIAQSDNDSIFKQALDFNGFGKDIIGYIPSYIEIQLLKQHINYINQYLSNNDKNEIKLNDIWVSESFDDANAWNSNGEIIQKNYTSGYYIFGKKIM